VRLAHHLVDTLCDVGRSDGAKVAIATANIEFEVGFHCVEYTLCLGACQEPPIGFQSIRFTLSVSVSPKMSAISFVSTLECRCLRMTIRANQTNIFDMIVVGISIFVF